MNDIELKNRCKHFMEELGVPVTNFCKRINLSTGSYYDWQRAKSKLSETRKQQIADYLGKYGF